jgi:YfiR/HmsC-like
MMSVHPRKRLEMTSGSHRRVAAGVDSRRIRGAFAIIVCWLLLNAFSDSFLLHGESAEYPLKLAFLYNFAKFVEWPSNSFRFPGAPLAICIVGHNPFSLGTEDELRSRPVGGHSVEFVALKPTDTLNACHIVFVPVTEKDQAARIVRSLKGSGALTVGESEGFAVKGGIINFTVEGGNVRFEINRIAADRAGLKISSKLLSLAKIVTEQD